MRAIALLTLRERGRQLAWTILGMVASAVGIGALWPSYRHIDIAEVYGALPESMQAMFGVDTGSFTGANFLNAELMSFMLPVILVGISIAAGSSVIAAEEGSGRMDLLLTTGLRRHQVVLGRLVGIGVELLVIVTATGIALAATDLVVGLDLGAPELAAAMTMAWLLGLTYATLALAVACRMHRGAAAVGIAATVALTSWIVGSLGEAIPALSNVARLTAFHAYMDGPPLVVGMDWSHAAQLAGEVCVLAALAVLGFRRRDIG